MSEQSLQAAIEAAGGAVEFLRNNPALPHQFPVKPEFSNWRSEQRAWRETASLLDQSHHMCDLFVSGPDALAVFADIGTNNFSRFQPGVAKQLVCCNHEGYLIGDGILFHLAENELDFVSPSPTLVDWVHYNAIRGGYDVTIERDENSFERPSGPPKLFRYESPGSERDGDHRETHRSSGPRRQVLPSHRADDRRHPRPSPAPRHGGAARI